MKEVEEVTERLQADGATRFRGGVRARQLQCLVGNAGGLALDAACGGGREDVKWGGECVGQARGWLQGASVMPGGARRVASATASWRRVSPTRRLKSEI